MYWCIVIVLTVCLVNPTGPGRGLGPPPHRIYAGKGVPAVPALQLSAGQGHRQPVHPHRPAPPHQGITTSRVQRLFMVKSANYVVGFIFDSICLPICG
jgi:hypothetical protein